jgi:ribA/ribD-fused uncharacterized protein
MTDQETRDATAVIRRVEERFGILGNMSPHPIEHGGYVWHTSEALFQALRFEDGSPIRDAVRRKKSPMQAKLLAKANVADMAIVPMSEQDLDNMRLVLGLKLAQHVEVRTTLALTESMPIVEDCTNRQRDSGLFWGAALRDGQWVGENWLGRLWMELRAP